MCAQLFIIGLLSLRSFQNPGAFRVALGAGGGRVGLGLFLPQLKLFCWQPPSCLGVVCEHLYIEVLCKGTKPELSAMVLLAATCRLDS